MTGALLTHPNHRDREDWREIECPACGGEGGFESEPHGISREDGSLLTRWKRCDHCKGTYRVWERVVPITLEDLDQ